MNATFDDADLLVTLESQPVDVFDQFDFGVVTMDPAGIVIGYNESESIRAGLSSSQVLGRNFFETVAPCMNNYLVRQRYLDEDSLDEYLDYVFTFRMAPTPVRLRLLAQSGSDRRYLVVQDR